jgi:hypothetical protein
MSLAILLENYMLKRVCYLISFFLIFNWSLLSSSGYASENLLTKAESYANAHNIDGPIHIAIGVASAALAEKFLPEDLPFREVAVHLTPIIVGIVKESTDKNVSTKDLIDYGFASIISIPILHVTW